MLKFSVASAKQEYRHYDKKNWSASCSTLASYRRCCQHNGQLLLTTGYDSRALLTTAGHGLTVKSNKRKY